ncbi:nucleoside triphosphate pyrophosphohydrolase [Myroides sp. LJL119]
MYTRKQQLESISRLLDILDQLRTQCPWDRKQTFESLRNLTLEEVYELADAISSKDYLELKKELGDVLMHVFFYAKIGSEEDLFDIKTIADGICEKLIFRHPHIYGAQKNLTSEQVEQNWEKLKLKEGNESVLSGVPNGLPAMVKAFRIQQKASGVGFDWPNEQQVWDKVNEELQEFSVERQALDKAKMEQEFGDLLFSLVNYARVVGIDPENALELTNKKFINRFKSMETQIKQHGQNIEELSLEQMDHYWDQIKAQEKLQ